jgi:ATP-binding cassette subfamily F protein 3
MIQIQFSNVSLVLGARAIFRGLNWEIQHDQKVGLIGPNGAGKSSLLKLIRGEYNPEPGGRVVFAQGIQTGYLAQEPDLDPVQTAYQAALDGNILYQQIADELERVETSLGDPQVYNHPNRLNRALERQQTLLDDYARMGGDSYPEKVRATLRNLGLPEGDMEKPLGVLSGGQKKLVGLARLILAMPDVLLLDEPDNHLDLAAKQFLERFIQTYPGAVVIISHDRYLLDACVTHIAELEDGMLIVSTGDYSTFMLDKQQRLARQEELFQIQQRQIARIETAIKRYALWAKTYDNEKFAKRARAIQNRLEKMDRLDCPVIERQRMDLRLNGWRGSSKVLEFQQVHKSFDGRTVLNPLDLVLYHGERVGVIGRNGSGKSVLLRLALGMEPPDGGDVIIGPSIRCGYYAQQHETLDLGKTVIETVCLAGEMSEARAVSYLKRYLFTYRQCSQKIGELSGGERSRLQLAVVVLSGANFLLLDEPTNNLDIASAEVLEAALAEFEGTVLVVSHDRYFLDQVVDRILVFDDGQVTGYPGGYSDYLEKLSQKIR